MSVTQNDQFGGTDNKQGILFVRINIDVKLFVIIGLVLLTVFVEVASYTLYKHVCKHAITSRLGTLKRKTLIC